MKKNFDAWNTEKKAVEQSISLILFHEREVWWCFLGTNIGVEIDGKHERFMRPALVLRKFNAYMSLILPMTTKDKGMNRYYERATGESGKEYTVCLSQIRALSSKRLFRKIDTISNSSYQLILEKTSHMIRDGLKNNETPPDGGESRRPKPIIP